MKCTSKRERKKHNSITRLTHLQLMTGGLRRERQYISRRGRNGIGEDVRIRIQYGDLRRVIGAREGIRRMVRSLMAQPFQP